MCATDDTGMNAGLADDGKAYASVYAALKETVLNLERAAEETERAARRARDRLESFEAARGVT